MIWAALLFWAQSAVPPQIQRGESLFFANTSGCATCHALKGRGTAVGPDLSIMGRLSPRAIATAVRSTATQYVQSVKLTSGEAFPGMPAGSDEKSHKYFDVSKMPPELRTLDKSEVKTIVSQNEWKHPPAIGNYASAQLADIIAFIRYTATGNKGAIAAEDVE